MRIRSLICVMTAILAVSCTYDYVREASDKCVPEEFSAKIGDMANLRGSWKMGETVSVFSKSGTGNYLYDTSEDTFRKLDAGVGLMADKCYYAVFPSSIAIMTEPGSFDLTFPDEQVYAGDRISPESNIMVAVSESAVDDDLVFHSISGYLKVLISEEEKVQSVVLSGNDNEVIAGQAVLKAAKFSIPQLSFTEGENAITLNCGQNGIDADEFLFSVPDMTFSKGVNLVVNTTSGTSIYREESPVKVTRGRVTELNFGGLGTSFTDFALRSAEGRQYHAVDLEGQDIVVCVPYGVDVKRLIPVFTHNGRTVELKGTGVVTSLSKEVDFSTPRTFSVISKEGEKETYNISVVDYNLPVVYVSTPGQVPIADKVNWIAESTFIVQNTDGSIEDYGSASIKGRGNSSWKRPKKSYSIKLAEKPKDRKVLGLPGHKRWCMIAVQWGYLGNSVGYELARRAASYTWQPHGRHVEFVLNGKHIGTYLLAEHIRIDDNRLDIKQMDPDDITEDKISGGYLLTFDRTFDDPNKFKSAYFKMPVMIKNPGDDELVPEQFNWIQNYINEMEASMKDNARFERREYADYLDVDTCIDTWFVWELAGPAGSHGEADFAHPNSAWYHKDRNGKLRAGPCWDFDSYLFTKQKLLCTEGQYYGRLFEDPEYRKRVKEKWPEFRAAVEGQGRFKTPITEFIDSCYNHVKYSAERNHKIWTWTYYELEEEYQTIRQGLPAKMDWLEKQIESL